MDYKFEYDRHYKGKCVSAGYMYSVSLESGLKTFCKWNQNGCDWLYVLKNFKREDMPDEDHEYYFSYEKPISP